MFKANSLYYSDGYKVGHKKMLAKGTNFLYGTWIPRNIKHAPKGITKIVSFGQQLTWKWINDEYKENFFGKPLNEALQFVKDMSMYLGMSYDGSHFTGLHNIGYLPIHVKALPEGLETNPNIPHMTFVNTIKGFAWLPLYLETIVSSLAWKPSTSATIALKYRRNCEEWVNKTDKEQAFLVDYLCHDFSARGLDPFSMISSGLGHATSFRGSDTLIVIPSARYFYNEPFDEVCINSVNASEHSVSTTKIFTVGEKQMIIDWLIEFPTGILSIVADTFDLWKLLVEYIADEEVKKLILARDGKVVIRPDSGNPTDIICGLEVFNHNGTQSIERKVNYFPGLETVSINDDSVNKNELKGVIEILWDIFGGTVNKQGYKVLDSHIGAIYGDSITLDRQIEIYSRLEAKGFAVTNIVLGVGSFTYQYNTRDTFGFAAKGSWFEADGIEYAIYKDPITDDGGKVSRKGLQRVDYENGEIVAYDNQNKEQENSGLLKPIYLNGELIDEVTLQDVKEKLTSQRK